MQTEIVNKQDDFFCIIREGWKDADDFIKWFGEEKKSIQNLLQIHGVIRFEQTRLKSETDFQNFAHVHNQDAGDYVDGNSPRTKLSSNIYSSTEYPAQAFISLHNELSYSTYVPEQLFFYCLIPASTGGETTILDGAAFLDQLDPAVMGDFLDRQIKYTRNLHGGQGMGLSWQETFETKDKSTVEKFCAEQEIQLTWKADGGLRLQQVRPTTLLHPRTQKRVWFNQADQFHPTNNAADVYEALCMIYEKEDFPLYVTYKNGDEIPGSILDHVRQTSRQNMIAIPWEQEALMLVDNFSALHGRNPYTGERRTLLSIVN